MGAQLRALRSRIRSIKSTAKITRAQELIAASQISKAQERLAAAKPYAREVTQAVSAVISHHVNLKHALLNENPDTSRVAILLITSDRGFCGGYNHNVIKQADALAELVRERGGEPVFYVTGSKGIDSFRFEKRPMAGEWSGFSGHPHYAVAAEIGEVLVEAFSTPTRDGGVGEVHVVYTEMISMLTQTRTVRRILPLAIEESRLRSGERPPPTYEFEPTASQVLDGLLKQYVNGRIWHMLLDSAASEHAARRQAMMSATDNANDLISNLTRQANMARQDEVTTELTEIVAGANALAEHR
jgi:F-type H+-transporting ATPase subunit gamma